MADKQLQLALAAAGPKEKKAPKPPRRWIGRVLFRDRSKWLPPVVVTVEAGSIHVAAARAIQEARKKSGPNGRRIHEMTVNVKPVTERAEARA